MAAQLEAFFMPANAGRNGQRFCLYHPAATPTPKAVVLHLHPFAEEMNKSRRMVANQSRALAAAGFAVLQIDLAGCGDSSGDFADASWEDWLEDAVLGAHWLRARSDAPLWLWGLRAGCLLATQTLGRIDAPCNLLFWAPPASGGQLLQQFLRIKMAGEMLDGRAKGGLAALRAQIAAGESVEVGGYTLSPDLCAGLGVANLRMGASRPTSGRRPRLEWFELASREGATLSPASAKASDQWTQDGYAVRTHLVPGPSFWQTSEIEEAPALIPATLAALTDGAT